MEQSKGTPRSRAHSFQQSPRPIPYDRLILQHQEYKIVRGSRSKQLLERRGKKVDDPLTLQDLFLTQRHGQGEEGEPPSFMFYHGTSLDNLHTILQCSVRRQVAPILTATDSERGVYGPGFYLTRSFSEACFYALKHDGRLGAILLFQIPASYRLFYVTSNPNHSQRQLGALAQLVDMTFSPTAWVGGHKHKEYFSARKPEELVEYLDSVILIAHDPTTNVHDRAASQPQMYKFNVRPTDSSERNALCDLLTDLGATTADDFARDKYQSYQVQLPGHISNDFMSLLFRRRPGASGRASAPPVNVQDVVSKCLTEALNLENENEGTSLKTISFYLRSPGSGDDNVPLKDVRRNTSLTRDEIRDHETNLLAALVRCIQNGSNGVTNNKLPNFVETCQQHLGLRITQDNDKNTSSYYVNLFVKPDWRWPVFGPSPEPVKKYYTCLDTIFRKSSTRIIPPTFPPSLPNVRFHFFERVFDSSFPSLTRFDTSTKQAIFLYFCVLLFCLLLFVIFMWYIKHIWFPLLLVPASLWVILGLIALDGCMIYLREYFLSRLMIMKGVMNENNTYYRWWKVCFRIRQLIGLSICCLGLVLIFLRWSKWLDTYDMSYQVSLETQPIWVCLLFYVFMDAFVSKLLGLPTSYADRGIAQDVQKRYQYDYYKSLVQLNVIVICIIVLHVSILWRWLDPPLY